jgi:TatA/E family protein of Tat protein translocase
MGSLGMPEILMILVIALIIFGPRKLPELGKSLGQGLAHFRRASEDFKRQWEDEVESERRRIESPDPPSYESSYSSEPASAATTEDGGNPEGEAATAEGSAPAEFQNQNEETAAEGEGSAESAQGGSPAREADKEPVRDWF